MPQMSRPHLVEKLVLKRWEMNGKRATEGEWTPSLFHFHLLLLLLLAPASPPPSSPSPPPSAPQQDQPDSPWRGNQTFWERRARDGLIKGGWQCKIEPRQGGSCGICWQEAFSCLRRETLENMWLCTFCLDIIQSIGHWKQRQVKLAGYNFGNRQSNYVKK